MTDQMDTVETVTTTAARAHVDRLVGELENRGLQVTARPPVLAVKNPAVAGTDARGRLMSPGMTQQILLLDDEHRGLTWCWVWPGMRSGERGAPDSPPQIEAMCPAGEIEFAADRIVKVVRLRDPADSSVDDAADGSGWTWAQRYFDTSDRIESSCLFPLTISPTTSCSSQRRWRTFSESEQRRSRDGRVPEGCPRN